jgi:hypothetical protein
VIVAVLRTSFPDARPEITASHSVVVPVYVIVVKFVHPENVFFPIGNPISIVALVNPLQPWNI